MLNVIQTQKSFLSPLPLPREIRCLLLDDNAFDRARIRRMSKQTNLSIFLDEVDSIGRLVKAIESETYDVILIDYLLPVGNGMAALNQIMQSSQNQDAGKIMITGFGAEKTAQEAMQAGCHDFLVKEEMSVEVLRNAMMTALTNAKCDKALAAHSIARHSKKQTDLVFTVQNTKLQKTSEQNSVVSIAHTQPDAPSDSPRREVPELDVNALLAAIEERAGCTIH